MSKNPKAQKKKYPAGIDETFVEEVEALSTDNLKSRLVGLNDGIDQAQDFLKKQEVLDLKAAYDEVAGPSRDAVRHGRAKIKFLLNLLREKGGL